MYDFFKDKLQFKPRIINNRGDFKGHLISLLLPKVSGVHVGDTFINERSLQLMRVTMNQTAEGRITLTGIPKPGGKRLPQIELLHGDYFVLVGRRYQRTGK